MKTTKHEWDEFWKVLGPDWYYDDSDVYPENDDDLKPGDIITFTRGSLFWQGSGLAKEVPGIFTKAQAQESKDEGFRLSRSLTAAFRKWQKSQTHATMSIQIPKVQLDQLRAFLAKNGGKIL